MTEDSARSILVTRILRNIAAADGKARDRLWTIIYDELRRLARHYMNAERPGHTLQPTALVHEAFLRLVHADIQWESRAHFMGVAANAIRHVLVDHARKKGSVKRDAGEKVTLVQDVPGAGAAPVEIIDLDRALQKLTRLDERKARVIELHYFGGLTTEEIAKAVGIGHATVERDLTFSKAWLKSNLAR